jgi:Cellulose binding domain
MSGHRKRPAPLTPAPGRHGRSTATQVWVRLLGVGLRRVAVTPTFAAGLGVVIAAIIAYPLTRAVISYGPDPPAAGHPCPIAACATTAPDGGGLASARPGLRLATPRPRPQRPRGTPAPSATPSPRPVMTYQTLRQWSGGFEAQVTIAMSAGPLPASWRLRLSYRSAAIVGVWGGTWTARSPHVVVVKPLGQGEPVTSPGGDIRIYVEVTGLPGPPTGCQLNGQPCGRLPSSQPARVAAASQAG